MRESSVLNAPRDRARYALGVALLFLPACSSEPQAPAPAPVPAPQQPAIEEPAASTSSEQPAKREPAEEPAAAEPQSEAPVESSSPQVRRDDAVEPALYAEPANEPAPQERTAFFRIDASAPATIPPVLLSKEHAALCKVKVGDVLPAIELPQLGGGTSGTKKLAELFGKKATVVVFWRGDSRMAQTELADLGPDVVEVFGKQGVAVLGVAVGESAANAQAVLEKAGAKFPTLLDADGKAFAQVGTAKLPRTYLVDPQGKILWFDIEYSLGTRRDLHRALHAVTGAPPEAGPPAPAGGSKE